MQEQIDEDADADADDAFEGEERQERPLTKATSSPSIMSSEYIDNGSVKPYISPFEGRNGEIPFGSIASASTTQPLSYERDAWFQEKMNDSSSTEAQTVKKDRFSNVFKQFKPRNRSKRDANGRTARARAELQQTRCTFITKSSANEPRGSAESGRRVAFPTRGSVRRCRGNASAVRLFASLRQESTPQEYGRAKEAFMNAISQASVISQDISRDVFDQLIDSREKKLTSGAVARKKQRQNSNRKKRKSKLQRQRRTTELIDVDDIEDDLADTEKAVQLPGLQDLKGEWRGVAIVGKFNRNLLVSRPQSTMKMTR